MLFYFIFIFNSLIMSEDIVIKAMRDEIARNLNKLNDNNFPKPYFISYSVYDIDSCISKAFFGNITSTSRDRKRIAKAEIRIGDVNFDNSNFIFDLNNYEPINYLITTEDNYDAIRWGLWYLSDEIYKNACEIFSKKKAYRQKREIKKTYPEIVFSQPVRLIIEEKKIEPDCIKYNNIFIKTSEVSRKYPMIKSIEFMFTIRKEILRYANSNGSYIKRPSYLVIFSLNLEIQDDKGYIKNDLKDFIYNSEEEFEDNIYRDVVEYLDIISKTFKAQEKDYFLGPCIFEKDASAQMINYLFVRNISFYPLPETEGEKYLKYYYDIPKLVDRIGKRIFPVFIKVYDDPLIEKYLGRFLVGSYRVDDEGVMPYRLTLVENGILKNIYSSQKVSEYSFSSNGRGRGSYFMDVYPFSSNVFVESFKAFDDDEFFKKAIDYAKEQNYDEIAIIKRMSSDLSDIEKELPKPLVVAVLNIKTNEIKYLTNIDFESVSLRMLRDINFTSDKRYVYNFFQKGPFYYSKSIPSTIVVPEKIFVREVEFIRSHEKPQKKPYISHPYFSDKNDFVK
ncbi:MAG: metallopeptidase TldD-related protein [Elusimicrobiales bacterium]|nr:metallopeptidase TldD-related protein [Elusimicrobiales bacterium]